MDKAAILNRLQMIESTESLESLTNRLCDALMVDIEFLERQLRVDEKREALREKIGGIAAPSGDSDRRQQQAEHPKRTEQENNKTIGTNIPFSSGLQIDSFSITQSPPHPHNSNGANSDLLYLQTISNSPQFTPAAYYNNHAVPSFTSTSTNDANNIWLDDHNDYVPMYREEIFWDINFRHSTAVYHSKLFLFAGMYWNIVFGLNEEGPSCGYYYLRLSPAQNLTTEARLICEFRIYQDTAIVYSRRSSHDLVFLPSESMTTNGLDRFIDEEIYQYVDSKMGKLRLSVVVSTDIGPSGELIGCCSPTLDY
eukprot:gene26737-35417_t